MPEKDNSEDRNNLNWSRRGILTKLGVAGGLTPVASTSRAAEVNKKDNPPKPYPDTDDPNSSYSRHVAEFDSRKRQLSRYESTGDPTELYGHELKQRLRENPDQSEFDVVVSTMGTRTSMRRERDGRTLYGFRPTQQEVVTLQSVGDVTYIGDIVSTKVCIRNVARRDLATVAHYPFVVEISPMAKNASLNSVSIENIVTDTWTRFTSAHGNYSVSDISIAIMEDGYDTIINLMHRIMLRISGSINRCRRISTKVETRSPQMTRALIMLRKSLTQPDTYSKMGILILICLLHSR